MFDAITNCTNNFQPLIDAVAGVVTIQVPILVGIIAVYFRAKSNNDHAKERNKIVADKLDHLLLRTDPAHNKRAGDKIKVNENDNSDGDGVG